MITFDELYHHYLKKSVTDPDSGLSEAEYDTSQLDCLLNPKNYAPVILNGECTCGEDGQNACAARCIFNAIVRTPEGKLTIDKDRCCGCAACIDACASGKLTASRDILPALDAIRSAKGPVYAMIAPAFTGQWNAGVTPGMLRSAFKAMGFSGMVEVALFADILTLKEAFEFDKNVNTDTDFQLTSCCCPVWISMIRKVYHELMPHVPGSVSPMIACGRTIKYLHPDAVTVFIGPCLAKKAEAREPDIADAVDYVLTFQEVRDIFEAMNIHPEEMEESERDHSSRAGRIYARSGGVSEAVKKTVEQLSPYRSIAVKTRHADGVPACRQMIEEIRAGKGMANFFEGMGCVGGCVGGPKALIPKETARDNVNAYGNEDIYQTPLENPYVAELLKKLGFETVEEFLDKSDIFTRQF